MDIVINKPNEVSFGKSIFQATTGLNGLGNKVKEGDNVTPVGTFSLRRVFYRPDRIQRPKTALPIKKIDPNLCWCTDPANINYNLLTNLPLSATHEVLWRQDNAYDIVVPIGYNDDPVIPGRGSAIFIHVAHSDFRPTQGCIALKALDLLNILVRCDGYTKISIKSPII